MIVLTYRISIINHNVPIRLININKNRKYTVNLCHGLYNAETITA